MKRRCTNPSLDGYKNYGAKGIGYCERWESYENFLEDMGERPEGMTLDRIDPAGDYEPSNCRWLSMTEQIRSRSNAVTLNGKPLIEICKEAGIEYGTLHRRIKRGWSIEDALNRPVRVRRSSHASDQQHRA
jgi:hypothetical protein